MKFPNFYEAQFVDGNGYLTPYMQFYHDELYQVLIGGLSDNGWTFPTISPTDLTTIEPAMPDGTGWYVTNNSSVYEIVFKINGALRKVTTTAYP